MFLSMLKKAYNMRLGTKSILAVVMLLSAISIILTTFFINRQKSSLMDEMSKRARSLASNMAFNSQMAVLSHDTRTMRTLIAGMRKESDIEDAYIVDLDGWILAHQDTSRVGEQIGFAAELDTLQPQKWIQRQGRGILRTIALIGFERKAADSDEILIFSLPDNPELGENTAYSEKLGYAVLDVSLESMNEAISAGTRRAVIITLIMVLLGALAVVYLVRSVAVPMYRLADATRAVAQDDLDQTVPVNRTDEIGILASSFNHMIRQLKVSREKIEAWNRELEAKVQKRTKELEEKHCELEKAYEALKTLDKAKDDFLSLVSHELRTPLSSVLLYSEMLLDGLDDSPEARTEFLTTIVENCKRLTRLINDVLDLSKIEAGRMPFKLEKLNFEELLNDTLSGIRPAVESKGINLICGNVKKSSRLWGDRDRVIQVLTNIISNAVKFTPEGGSITVSLTSGDGMGKVEITDTGQGISKEDIPKVFDRFTHLGSIDHHTQGTGLGMTICKSIIERLNGEIWIESKLSQGTTIFFTLPTADRSSNITKEEEKATEHGTRPE
jgi:signal transduction histidine kinase